MPPRKRYFDDTSDATMSPVSSHEEEKDKSLWQRIGGLPGAAGAATRGITGILAAGGPWGAAIGGGGEALAQYLESYNKDLPPQSLAQRAARIVVEARLGAVPFGQLVKKGEALSNFIRGGVFSGAGDVARQMAEEGSIDPTKVDVGRAATAGTIGGSASAGVQKFMDFLNNRSAAKAASEAGSELSGTTVKAPTKTVGGRQVSTARQAAPAPAKSQAPSSKLADDFLALLEGERPGVFKRTPAKTEPKAPPTEFGVPKKIDTRHTIGAPPHNTEDFVGDFQKELSKNLDKRVGAASKEAQAKTQFESDQYIKQLDEERSLDEAFQTAMNKRNEKYLDDLAAAERIAAEREGLEEVSKTVTETSTQNIPGGRVTATKKFAKPQSDDIPEEQLDEIIPPGTKVREVYDSWRAGGLSHEKALERAARGDVPKGGVKVVKAKPEAPQSPLAKALTPATPVEAVKSPDAAEREFLAKWLADDLAEMPFTPGGTTPGQRAAAFENWRPGDPEAAKYAIGEGFSSGRAAGTPTQEMLNAAGITGSRPEIADKLRRMLEAGSLDPRVEKVLDDLRGTWNPETGKFDVTGNLRSPVTLPPEGPFFDKYMAQVSDAVDTGENTLDELLGFFGSQVANEGRRANIQDALRTGEDRVLQNKQIERFLAGQNKAPEAPEAQNPLARFFKSRVDAMGEAYRGAKGDPNVPKVGARALGKGLQQEAAAAGLPTRGSRGQIRQPKPKVEVPAPVEPQPFEAGWPSQADIIEQSAPRVAEPEDSELTKLLRFFRNRGEAEAADTSWVARELESLQDPAILSAARQAQFDPITAPVHQAREQEIADLMAENRAIQEELALRERLEAMPTPRGPQPEGSVPKKAGKPAAPPAPAIAKEPGLPRLVKPEGGTLIRRTKGGDEAGMFRPEVALPMLSTALGGLTGSIYGEQEYDDPITGALLGAAGGGALGFGGANLGKIAAKGSGALGEIAQGVRESLGSREDIAEGVTQAIEKFPNLQRANLLTGFNLPVNAAVGPWGSVLFGGLENALSNKIAGGDDLRGANVLSEAMNPVEFLRRMYQNRDEAARLVAQGELGRSEGVNLNPGGNMLEQYMALPAVAMTAGDVTARNILTKAGFPEDIARQITLTSEPVGAIGRAIANFGRGAVDETTPRGNRIGKALLNSMLPFRRTPGNIVDQGWDRLPGFGLLSHAIEPGDTDWSTALAQQAISVPLAAASYGLGSNLDPETAKWVRRVVSNAAGQYSLPASLAFTAGQAANRGLSNDQTVLRLANEAFPLPTTEGISDLGRFLSNAFSGEPAELPRTMQPTIIRDIFSPPEQVPVRVGGLPDLGEYRRRRGQ